MQSKNYDNRIQKNQDLDDWKFWLSQFWINSLFTPLKLNSIFKNPPCMGRHTTHLLFMGTVGVQ